MNINLKIKKTNTNNSETDFDSIAKLLHSMCFDPVINKKVVNILKMKSYPRHIVLSNWLEQLRLNKAPEKLTQTLTYFFDDSIAEKVYNLIKRSKVKK